MLSIENKMYIIEYPWTNIRYLVVKVLNLRDLELFKFDSDFKPNWYGLISKMGLSPRESHCELINSHQFVCVENVTGTFDVIC